MPLTGDAKRAYQREYMRKKRALIKKVAQKKEKRRQKLGVMAIMSGADVRAMRQAGIDPEYVEDESGKVSSKVFYALLRDRDAIKAHLSWHHDQIGKPDVGTIVEQLQEQVWVLQGVDRLSGQYSWLT